MFFVKEDERTISLHPSFFGPNTQKYLADQLLADVEGTIQDDYFVVCVLDPLEYSEGKIVPSSAFAEFKVHYRAVVWKPYKGEVVDGQVASLDGNGFKVNIGPLQIYVSKSAIGHGLVYNGQATPPQWADDEGSHILEKGSQVRLKLKGIRAEMGQMFAIALMKEDYLGVI